jgi:hypothetical protein
MRSCFRVHAVVVVLALGAACKGKPNVGLDIALPASVVPNTVWFEVGAFRNASCGALTPLLSGGIPEGATTRVAFRRDDKTTPTFGDLPRDSYAFAAVARGEDCGIVATGCSEVDVGSASSVLVSMNATADATAGACGAGAACEAARCVPANDNADPSVGANCSLELLGAGPFATPIGGSGTLVSAPEIAATPSGFVIVYREVDANATNARITILPIDPAGGALAAGRPLLGGRCAGTEETDGLGLLLNGSDGQVVVARPACDDKPGLELLNFSSTPDVTNEDQSHLVPSPTAQSITISASGAAAVRAAGNVLAFVEDGVARVSTVTSAGVSGPSGTFGATASNTGAWAAASESVLALLAAGPASGGAPPPSDAGADGAAPVDAGPSPESGPTLRLVMLPVATPLDQLVAPDAPRTPIEFPGSWGAVAARASRVIVVSEGTGPGRSVTYRTFDANNPEVVETNGFSVEGTPKVTNADVAMQGDRVFFAVLKQGLVGLNAYAGASTTPRPLHAVNFANEPRIPAINQVRDGKVAVAATDTRVAVAWTTAKVLTSNDPAGGYAVFACTQ